MLQLRRAPLALSIWLAGTAVCFAGEGSVWRSLIETSPILWGAMLVAAILGYALLGHLVFVLQKKRVDPPALIRELARAIESGNYQEAWEICNRWRQTVLARILQPSLERIGQSLEAVEMRLASEGRRERRHVSALLWSMIAVGGVVAGLCAAAIGQEMNGLAGFAMSPNGPRATAIAMGNIGMLVAAAIAVVVPIGMAACWLRTRAVGLLQQAGAQARQLVASLPYEDIEGVRIGSDFHAGTLLGETALSQTERLQVSKELTTLCPSCNGPINSSRTACPHCGQLLTWS